ncbi:MAG: DUF4271 domain-containing protein [Bacteroidales bacterium]|nr:DUF4271 domain-containing protein [Bacteroidales bacterium]
MKTNSFDGILNNDTVTEIYSEVQGVDNQYKDFKFVTEKPEEWGGPQLRDVSYISPGWNFVILFLAMIIVVLNKFLFPQRFASIMAMSFQNAGSDRIIRENPPFFNIISMSSVVAFVMTLSIFVQKFYVIYGGNDILYDNMSFFFDVVMVVAAVFIFNYLLTLFYSWLFKADALLHFHVNLHISTMTTTNVILIPLMLILFFYPYRFLCVVIIAILLILFSIRFIKLLIEVRMLSKLNFVNIFLYLCTVEILPVLIIFKMVLMAI